MFLLLFVNVVCLLWILFCFLLSFCFLCCCFLRCFLFFKCDIIKFIYASYRNKDKTLRKLVIYIFKNNIIIIVCVCVCVCVCVGGWVCVCVCVKHVVKNESFAHPFN